MSAALLPVVAAETSIGAIADLLRDEMEAQSDTRGLLDEWASTVARENVEVVKAVSLVFAGDTDDMTSAALCGMAIAYRVLSAQAEIAALGQMAGTPVAEPFAGILANFERQAVLNSVALNPHLCAFCDAGKERPAVTNAEGLPACRTCADTCNDCGLLPCVCVDDREPNRDEIRADHEAAQERKFGRYMEGDL